MPDDFRSCKNPSASAGFVIWPALCPGLPGLLRVTCQASAPRTANSQENCDPNERKIVDFLPVPSVRRTVVINDVEGPLWLIASSPRQ
jgi:hypothetical protein